MFASKKMTPRLSVCILTQNCADKLVNAIKSVESFADEIVVVDGGSSDNTKEVASSFEKVCYYYNPWPNNMGLQWNYAMDQATGDWILMLASDEAVGANMRKKIGKLIRSRRHNCYRFPVYWVIETDPLLYVESKKLYPCYNQRLFRKLPQYRFVVNSEARSVHSTFPEEVQGVGKKIKNTHIFHYDFIHNDRQAREEKVRKYVALDPKSSYTSEASYLYEDYPHKVKKCREKL
jgi:glycosyltransferase involved in cell wall biosynthesis